MSLGPLVALVVEPLVQGACGMHMHSPAFLRRLCEKARALGALAQDRPHFVNALVGVSDGRLVPVPGGVLIKNAEGDIIGAVGVSGDTSDNDEMAAVAGIEAANLEAGI